MGVGWIVKTSEVSSRQHTDSKKGKTLLVFASVAVLSMLTTMIIRYRKLVVNRLKKLSLFGTKITGVDHAGVVITNGKVIKVEDSDGIEITLRGCGLSEKMIQKAIEKDYTHE